jgi:hypothetical protein
MLSVVEWKPDTPLVDPFCGQEHQAEGTAGAQYCAGFATIVRMNGTVRR